jgi:hypothetical protein
VYIWLTPDRRDPQNFPEMGISHYEEEQPIYAYFNAGSPRHRAQGFCKIRYGLPWRREIEISVHSILTDNLCEEFGKEKQELLLGEAQPLIHAEVPKLTSGFAYLQ